MFLIALEAKPRFHLVESSWCKDFDDVRETYESVISIWSIGSVSRQKKFYTFLGYFFYEK